VAREYAYVQLDKLKVVLRQIDPKSYWELVVYSSAHSSERRRVYFNFRTCSHLGPLAARFAAEFVVWAASKERASALAALIPIRAWMRHLSEFANVDLSDPLSWGSETWLLHTTEWWLSIRADADLADVTKNQYRASAANFIARMQTLGLVPRFRFPKGIEKPKRGKKLSLAMVKQVSPEIDDSHRLNDEVRAALAELEFLDDLTDSALGATRSAVERSIRHFWFEWQEARHIVSSDLFDPIGFMERHCISREPLKLRRGWQRELTDDTDMIALLEHYYDGIIPIDEPGNPLVRWIYNRFSIGHFRDLLHSTPDTVIPFLIVMLLDKPIEVSYAAGLTVTAMKDTANPSNKRVTYVKKRANHRKITVIWAAGDDRVLDRRSHRPIGAATAFRCLQEMRQPLEKFAEKRDADKLFLVLGHQGRRETVRALPAQTLIDAWDRFRASDPLLSRYRFTPDKLRSTLILRAFIVSGGDIFEAFRVAQHKSLRTTQRYINEQVSQQISAGDARNVQDAITLRATESRTDLRGELRISERDVKRVMDKATNLGFLAYSQQPETTRKEMESDIIRFFTTGEIVVIEDTTVAAELTIFKRHLVSELPVIRNDLEFEFTWLPLLVFVNAALEAMLPDVRQHGRQLASEMDIEYLEPQRV
jgi:CBS domain-containing protein